MSRKTWTVAVTDDDIRRGRPSPLSCPVSLATTRTLGHRAAIGRGSRKGHVVGIMRLIDLGVEVRLSEAVGRFVRDFDSGRPVAPFTFRVWR